MQPLGNAKGPLAHCDTSGRRPARLASLVAEPTASRGHVPAGTRARSRARPPLTPHPPLLYRFPRSCHPTAPSPNPRRGQDPATALPRLPPLPLGPGPTCMLSTSSRSLGCALSGANTSCRGNGDEGVAGAVDRPPPRSRNRARASRRPRRGGVVCSHLQRPSPSARVLHLCTVPALALCVHTHCPTPSSPPPPPRHLLVQDRVHQLWVALQAGRQHGVDHLQHDAQEPGEHLRQGGE